MKLYEMEGFLRGKCIPGDMKVNETNAEYLVRKFAEADARCAALAAESAGLKKAEPAPFSKLMMEALDIYQAGADEVPELAMLSAYKKLRDGLKTPATDAILAEVRASAITDALKSLDGVFDTDCVMESNGISYEDAEQRTAGAYAVSKALDEFAAQLRKEAK